MTENQKSSEEIWTSIVTCLQSCHQADTWISWRQRFNTNHPEHIRQAEIENPEQWAKANWFAAKHVYCIHKEEMDKYLDYLKSATNVYPGVSMQVEIFMAMKQVVENEMGDQLEQQILKEDDMAMVKTKWENDELLVDDEEIIEQEEIDEDEEYVRQTESSYEESDDEELNPFDDLETDEEEDDEF